jgi:general stress protein YciG
MSYDTESQSTPPEASVRGFAAMSKDRQREIAKRGGRAAHERGTAHEFSGAEAREAGRKGGEVVSRNREYMSAIGREGARKSALVRARMKAERAAAAAAREEATPAKSEASSG